MKNRICIHFNLLDKVRCRAHTSSGLLSPPPSCLTDRRSRRSYHPPQNELWGGGRKEKHREYVLLYTCRGANKIKRFTIRLLSRFLKPATSFYQLCSILDVSYPPWTPPWQYGTHMNTPDPTQQQKTSVSWLELLYLSHVVFSFWLCYIFCLTV